MRIFQQFAAIDWSGARGSSHPGIAVALCETGSSAPQLVSPPGRHWARQDVCDWLRALDGNVLIGMDFSFAPPFADASAYLPGDETPKQAAAFHAYVDAQCNDEDLGAGRFLEQRHRRHFYFGAADGPKSGYMRWRACEARYNAGGGGKASTVFDAIGAAQVAKASFSGMRLLHQLTGAVAVWPFDAIPEAGPVIVEIYTRIAAQAAGLPRHRSKIRDADALDDALAALGSASHAPLKHYSDHATDALVTAAWLRANASNAILWNPPGMTRAIALTEGWTFGVA